MLVLISELDYFKVYSLLTQVFKCPNTVWVISIKIAANRMECSGAAVHEPKVAMSTAKHWREAYGSVCVPELNISVVLTPSVKSPENNRGCEGVKNSLLIPLISVDMLKGQMCTNFWTYTL